MIDWDIVLIAACVASVFMVAGIMFQKWIEKPHGHLLVRNGSVIGEYMERYCDRTATPIDKIVLVAYEVAEDETVFRVESIEMYPEIWMGDD